MKKSDLQQIVKEAIAEVKQENLQQEGKLGRFLSGVALLGALLAGNTAVNNQIYSQSPKLKVLVQKLEKAKAEGNEDLVDQIEDQIKFQKIRIDVNR
tara:strand:- start:330 stop:620 length:291 start_codon:yes stop_codon:yes gene_type:complete